MSDKYQTFEDLPWSLPQVYKNISKTYPDSKFILRLRRLEKVWLDRMRRHTRARIWECHKTIHGAYQVDGNEKDFLKKYSDHTRDVRAYFATEEMNGRGMKILIDALDESDNDRWRKLVKFLGAGIPGGIEMLGNFPKSNSGGLWTNKDPLGAIWAQYQLMYWGEKPIISYVGSLGRLLALGF